MPSGMKLLSSCSCGRWVKQTLFISEIQQYPGHTQRLHEVRSTFEAFEMSLEDGMSGLLLVFCIGAVFRVAALGLLFLQKHAEGDTTLLGKALEIVSQLAERCYLRSTDWPLADGDTVRSVGVWSRNAVTGVSLVPGDPKPTRRNRSIVARSSLVSVSEPLLGAADPADAEGGGAGPAEPGSSGATASA